VKRIADNFVNFPARALEFAVGDVVVPFGFLDSQVGRVTAVWPAIGMADVEMPTGNHRWPVEELQRFQNGVAQPPSAGMNTAPGESRTVPVAGGPGRVASPKKGDAAWNFLEAIADLPYIKFADFVTKGQIQIEWTAKVRGTEIEVQMKEIAGRFGLEVEGFKVSPAGTATFKFHPRGRQASASRVASAFVKSALYWASQDRKHKMTKSECESGQMLCPKCKDAPLKRAVYKREDGQSVRLYGCKECLFLIKESDVVNHPNNLEEVA
jgi:hypothetical protein